MKGYISTFKFGFKQILKDYMMILIIIAPFLCGMFFRFLIPVIDELISNQFGIGRIIFPYYQILDITLVFITPYIICIILTFLILEEKDENISSYIFITPVGYSGYIYARLIIPSFFAVLLSFIVLMLFKLTNMGILLSLVLVVLSTLYALCSTLIVVSNAKNKVEGLALIKLTSITFLGVLVPYFIKGNMQYIFSFLPSFWLSKVAMEYGNRFFSINVVLGLICCMIWINLFYFSFKRKIFI